MGAYYYLVGQLPTLNYGAGAPMSAEQFRALCADLMEEGDGRLLGACALEPWSAEGATELPAPTSSVLIDGWRIWERTLRLNLARLRAGKLKRDASSLPDAPADPLDAASLAKAALAMESPLEAEQFLDRSRWNAIEALQGFDYFGRDTVYAYLLKLLLLERKAAFKVEEGFAEYKGLYASIMEHGPASTQSGEPK